MAVAASRAGTPALHEGPRPRGVYTRDDIHGDTVLDCDVVVIGSGAGGATVAAELAEAGFDVVVLEEGSYYQTRDFTANTSAMIRQLYRDGGATMAIGSPPILYQEGRAVGGSTVINGGMSWRTPEKILARWQKEAGIDTSAQEMEPYFERVEKRIHVAPMDADAIGIDNKLLKKGADAKGWEIIGNLRNQVHCIGSNRCAMGCPTGAKQSSLVTYVPRALHYGARVYADVRVDRITRHGKRATGVIGRVRHPDGRRGHHVAVRAKLVVSACGAIHTPALLVRSGFRSPSGRIGHNLSMHPNVKVVALFDEPVTGWKGTHQAYQVREFQDQGLVFASINVPPGLMAMSLPQRGRALGELMDQYDHMMLAGMLLEDTETGRVRTINGNPQAFYQLNAHDAGNLQKGVSLLCELLFAAGARRIMLPFHGAKDLYTADDARRLLDQTIPPGGWEVLTVHMMGTAAMGTDRLGSVTDQFGMVHDADRLMVADASLFPSPIGVNPMETIMALATRCAAHVIDNAGRYLS
jgi:choline dehydrogenase-like flavoprotein